MAANVQHISQLLSTQQHGVCDGSVIAVHIGAGMWQWHVWAVVPAADVGWWCSGGWQIVGGPPIHLNNHRSDVGVCGGG